MRPPIHPPSEKPFLNILKTLNPLIIEPIRFPKRPVSISMGPAIAAPPSPAVIIPFSGPNLFIKFDIDVKAFIKTVATFVAASPIGRMLALNPSSAF